MPPKKNEILVDRQGVVEFGSLHRLPELRGRSGDDQHTKSDELSSENNFTVFTVFTQKHSEASLAEPLKHADSHSRQLQDSIGTTRGEQCLDTC